MDLSFSFRPDAELLVLPGDLAALLVGVAARQAASPAAAAQACWAATVPSLFLPAQGAFHAGMAAALTAWGHA